MYETYKNLRKLSELYTGQTDLAQVAQHYQTTQCPITFSYAFVKVWTISVSVSKRYYGLTEEDKVSFVTEELHKALIDFNVTKNDALHNFYSVYLRRRFYAETQMLHMDKRKANTAATSYEELAVTFEGRNDNNLEVAEINLFLQQGDNLSEKEQRYCQIVANSTGNLIKDSDAAKLMGISASAINQMRKRLATKLQPLLQLQ